jgi:23S rRNA (uracil1939-C5)-methyltransferase
MSEGERAEIVITDLGRAGEGVGRTPDGLVVFVEGATLGDRVAVTVPPARRRMARATAAEILVPSPERVPAPCPHFGRCGGCQLQDLALAAQLAWKRRSVAEALRRIGGLDAPVAETVPSPDPYGYRHKVAMPVGGPPLRLGLYARGSHELTAGVDCLVAAPPLAAAMAAAEAALAEGGADPTRLRHVVGRLSRATGEVLLTVVGLDRELPEAAVERLLATVPGLSSLWVSRHSGRGNRVLGEELHHVAGQRYIVEELAGRRFLLSPEDFFQVNPAVADRLFRDLAAALAPGGRVADLFSGVGVAALAVAERAAAVVGVEVVAQAVRDARRNARRNGVTNVEFIVGAVEAALPLLGRLDAVILDPPRKGAPGLAAAIRAAGAREVLYVSCDPATLARDAAELAQAGYRLRSVTPYDMFPQTVHVECLAHFVDERG